MGIALIALIAGGCTGIGALPSGVVTGKVITRADQRVPRLVYLEPQDEVGWNPFRRAPSRLALSQLLDARLALVPSGEQVRIDNDTAVIHQLFSRSNRNVIELEALESGDGAPIGALQTGEIRLYCALHPWEDATLLATPSRWAALIDANGSFRIEEVREGDYRLMVWDRGEVRGFARIRVVDGATMAIDLPLALSGSAGRD
jgi:hypothetical protein